ncbi:MAG: BON domain-containing protein [Desulfobacteraceae bacterium]|nr:MAG: BON domain-containing protein [Desulfobacteraceae bacterium]
MPLVTISGGMGTGFGRIAQVVASKAGLELYDDQRLHSEAIRMGIRAKDLKGIDEKAPGFFDSLRVNPELYLDILESVVYSVSRSGKGVIIGHGSQILLREFGCALHTLIHAPEEYRIQQISGKGQMSREGARKLIYKSDSERGGFLRFAYHIDWDDLSHYDLVINTAKLGIEGAAEVILHSLRLQVINECSMQALDAIERLTLQKRAEAAVVKTGMQYFNFSHVEVPEKGVVVITGMATTEEDKARIVNAVNSTPGVTTVRDEINVMPVAGY